MSKKNKVLLIGWDAADWQIIGPLLAKGQMPALQRLINNGVYGNMATMNPPYSPMLWSTVATGKTPDKHGVLGFIELMPDMKGVRPVTVNSRKSRAIWNILHNQGLKSNLVGWWPSFPAEPINGVVVTDKFQKVKQDPKAKNPIVKGTVHPESLVNDIQDLRMFSHEITEAHILPFIPKAGQIDQEKHKGLQAFARIMAENSSIHAAATNLLRTTDWDFMAIYYDLIDHICHAFMKYHPPKLNSVPQDLYDIYNECVIGAYRFQDMMLDRTLSLVDKDTTVIVMSDHGFESGHKRIVKMPKYPAAPSLDHRQFGMFVASGPNIKKNEKVFGLGLIDVAPTILHMYNLPIGKDMDGKVALDIFKDVKEPNYIDTWENVSGDFGEQDKSKEADQLSDQETLEQLIDLGYIERPDEKMETAVLKTKCDLKHNLARVYSGKKDYDRAKEILLDLISEDYPVFEQEEIESLKKKKDSIDVKVGDSKIDVIPFYMDLLSISIATKDFDKAEIYLKELKTRDKYFEINTYFSEAKILINKGKVHEALKLLNKAKNNKPNSEVWYQIGNIYRQLNEFENAKEAYESSLKYESDKAKTHQALAETYIRLGDYEEAIDHAFVAIELVKYFPKAHYTLGEALEKFGDLENAKKAYETAAMLKPKTHFRAETAIQNINKKQNSIDLTDKSTFQYIENQIVVVSGLPRSGTSLMMQMLDKGGLEVLTDNNRKADKSNPKGYYEYDPVMSIARDNTWIEKAQGKSVKVVAPLLKYLDPKYRYKVIFMNRDLGEVVKSQQVMLGKDPEVLPTRLLETYEKHLNQVSIWKNKEPHVELMYVNHKDVINSPNDITEKISKFLGLKNLDTEKMCACVDTKLYRNRS
ncbi:alkaline phosphatase family protein [Winogradskyella marincola]|uniref:Alkaline phosphatase family protein n=1 Tax=Winogradskyella marincola TaxID=3037795 RepID=A0ABT6FZ25_9FLAO|nr:alkaline phosphatase family protein [Winogradskyella sp. YYF002]MDG4715036.1 alkaline phosphatase family protein [Winogradskyella sp. YYF002]